MSFSGLSTAMARGARSFRSSRTHSSRSPISIQLSLLPTPIRSQKFLIDSGV